MKIKEILYTICLYQYPIAEQDIIRWEVQFVNKIIYKKVLPYVNIFGIRLGTEYIYLIKRDDLDWGIYEAVFCIPYMMDKSNEIKLHYDYMYYHSNIKNILNNFLIENTDTSPMNFNKMVITGAVDSGLLSKFYECLKELNK